MIALAFPDPIENNTLFTACKQDELACKPIASKPS